MSSQEDGNEQGAGRSGCAQTIADCAIDADASALAERIARHARKCQLDKNWLESGDIRASAFRIVWFGGVATGPQSDGAFAGPGQQGDSGREDDRCRGRDPAQVDRHCRAVAAGRSIDQLISASTSAIRFSSVARSAQRSVACPTLRPALNALL